MPQIRLEGIAKRFGPAVAEDGLSLTVEDGEYMCVLGPTGAGKTTLLRIVCGLTDPDSGRVLFDGEDVTGAEAADRGATMLSQSYSLFPQMTVMENVLFAPRMKKWDPEESRRLARSMLNLVHMEGRAQALPGELSGGQRQRVALARALASGSRVLLLDEPLRALDARLRLELRKELKSMVKEMGMTAIHVTHDQDEALEMADRIAVLRAGRVLQAGTPREVFEEPASPFVANFVGRSNMISGTVESNSGGAMRVRADGGAAFDARPTAHGPGDRVLVAVKVGSTKISTKEPGYFKAVVERVLYEGATATVELSAPAAGGALSAKIPNRRFDDYPPGTEVDVRWNPERASAFDYPEGGPERELRVDRCRG